MAPVAAVTKIIKIGLKIMKASKAKVSSKAIVKSSAKLSKNAKRGSKIKKRLRVQGKKYLKKRRERKERERKETELEQQKAQRKGSTNRVQATGQTIFQRLMSLLTALVAGFWLDKVMKVVGVVKNASKILEDIVKKFKQFFGLIEPIFKKIGEVVGNVLKSIQSVDLGGLKDRMQESISGLTNILGNLKEQIFNVVKSMFGFGNKEEKELDKEKDDDDNDDKRLQSSVTDAQKTLSAQTSSFNDSLNTIKKEATGPKFVDNENGKEFREKITADLSTITSDGMTFPRGRSGSGETFGGKGGSTYEQNEENQTDAGGTSDVKQSGPKAQIGNKLNISKSKKKIDTSTITPERRSKNRIMVVGGDNNPQSSGRGRTSSEGGFIIQEKDNFLKDVFTLSLF